MTTEKNSQRQQTLTQSDTRMVEDHSIIYDTIHKVVLETLWRTPDTLGNTYPLKTTRTEMTGGHQTQNDIVTQSHDTIYLHDASITSEKTESDIRSPSTSEMLPWLIILGLIALCVLVIAIRVLIKT